MERRHRLFVRLLALVMASGLGLGEARAADTQDALHLSCSQKEFLCLEPMLVTVRLDSARHQGLPAQPGAVSKAMHASKSKSKAEQSAALEASKRGTLKFDIQPVVKERPGAKPLPLEQQDPEAKVQQRTYDLLEWFAFPDQGGPWTVRAVFEHGGTKVVSDRITVRLSRPAKGDPEFEPMSRLHHTPWSNYDSNAFCGDTFDLVQKWPASRFAKYCHYWNGRYSQNKMEYDKAIASYGVVLEKYPDFVLADAAEYGIIECLLAQKKMPEAQKRAVALGQKLRDQATKVGIKPGTGLTSVHQLTQNVAAQLQRDPGLE
jgi:hypothetical protein